MGKFLPSLKIKRGSIISFAGFALVIYIVFLFILIYISQSDLRATALAKFQADAEKNAASMSYFFAERINDLKDLGVSRELSSFFENKALGMSMEYGLRASLLDIAELFNRILERKEINDHRIYDLIAFIDDTGMLLVSDQATDRIRIPGIDPARLLNKNHVDPVIVVESHGSYRQLFVSVAYFFKNRYQGQLVARIDYDTVYQNLVSSSHNTGYHYSFVFTEQGPFLAVEPHSYPPFFDDLLPQLKDIKAGFARFLRIDQAGGSTLEMLAAKIPVQETPFYLATVTSADSVVGFTASKQLLLALMVLALFVLWGSAAGIRINIQNLVLKAHYEEAAKQQNVLEVKNAQLNEEIFRRQQSEARLNYLAHHDPLTKLPNRLLFRDRLQQALERAQRRRYEIAVLFLDLDRFKNINDTLGHPVGDCFLQEVSRRLVRCLRKEDSAARLGGDEFTVILEGPLEAGNVIEVAQRLLTSLAHPYSWEGHELFITVSIGISLYPHHGREVTELLKNADTAMYKAKEKGRNNYQFYAPELTITAVERFNLETSLRKALEREEFVLYYQPVLCCKTHRLVGVEALVRWQRQPGDMVPPDKFIPLAEETGLIEPIGEWVLSTACAQARNWQRAGLPGLRMAVNLSARQVMSSRLVSQIRTALDESGLDPRLLELEITESATMYEPDRAIATFNALKALGVSLAIDDFGTGYSSMNYLKRFNVDVLKIDKSFIQDIPQDPSDELIVKAIIALGHSMRLRVLAEGVETQDQDAFLAREGCDEKQGYFFYKPMPAELLADILRGEKSKVIMFPGEAGTIKHASTPKRN